MTIDPPHDPMGQAVLDHQQGKPTKKLRVLSSMFDEDEMPVSHLFRTYSEMPRLEQLALDLSKGKVLDVGACAGCHTLHLQEKGFNVTAIDISPLSVETMKLRGIRQVMLADMFEDNIGNNYDTILLLMNGTSIAGTLDRLPLFFNKLKTMLAPDGQILLDSTDIRYIYEDENGNFDHDGTKYYGQVDYRMQYGHIKGRRFDCLYVDPATMQRCATATGFNSEILEQNDEYAYLMRLTPLPHACTNNEPKSVIRS